MQIKVLFIHYRNISKVYTTLIIGQISCFIQFLWTKFKRIFTNKSRTFLEPYKEKLNKLHSKLKKRILFYCKLYYLLLLLKFFYLTVSLLSAWSIQLLSDSKQASYFLHINFIWQKAKLDDFLTIMLFGSCETLYFLPVVFIWQQTFLTFF